MTMQVTSNQSPLLLTSPLLKFRKKARVLRQSEANAKIFIGTCDLNRRFFAMK